MSIIPVKRNNDLTYKKGLNKLLCNFTEWIGDTHMRQEHLLYRAVCTLIPNFPILPDYWTKYTVHLHLVRVVFMKKFHLTLLEAT